MTHPLDDNARSVLLHRLVTAQDRSARIEAAAEIRALVKALEQARRAAMRAEYANRRPPAVSEPSA